MRHTSIITLFISLLTTLLHNNTYGQQYIGLNTASFSAVNHIPNNPSWVTHSHDGMEIMLFSVNALAGNNAFSLRKKYVFNGFEEAPVDGIDIIRDEQIYRKHVWANLEISGPAVSFKYKDEHHFGFYTRVRQIYRGGNINSSALEILGKTPTEVFYDQPVTYTKAGFTTHTFAEVGISYGRILINDYYNVVKAGASLKYLAGFVGASVYTRSLEYTQKSSDTVASIQGDISAMYTYNAGAYIDNTAQNDLTSWFQRAGRGGLGLDIGAQYEFHPNGDPNKPSPYLFSVSASITDIGSIGYVADTGSGTYDVAMKNLDIDQYQYREHEGINWYTLRLQSDTNIAVNNRTPAEKFRIGLPTALRVNADYNLSNHFNFAVNLLLNLRGNSKTIYKPGYVNCLNFTPSYRSRYFSFGVPFSIMGYQTIAIGANLRIGPLYIGSTSIASMLLVNRLQNIDGYAGVIWKITKREKYYYKTDMFRQ